MREPDVLLIFLSRPNTDAKYVSQYTPLEINQDNSERRRKKKKTNRSRWLGNAGEDVIDKNRFEFIIV